MRDLERTPLQRAVIFSGAKSRGRAAFPHPLSLTPYFGILGEKKN